MKGYAGKEERSKRTPKVLLGYQQRWTVDESEVKVMEKSRRVGLSWGEAAEDSLLAASENGMDVFYIGYNKDMSTEFIEDCADWSRFYNLAAGSIEAFIWKDEGEEKKDIQAFRIRFPSGFKIVALSSRPANLRGKQGKIVIDEAAFHDDLPGLLKAAIAMLMWGGRVVVISTHNGSDHPFNELVQEIRSGKKPYSLHRVTLDDALKDGLYRRVCLRLGQDWSEAGEKKWCEKLIHFYGDDSDEELFCVPARGGGSFLTVNLIEGVWDEDIPVLRWRPPETNFVDWPDDKRFREMNAWLEETVLPVLTARVMAGQLSWFGEDFGRTSDLTVIWPLQETVAASYFTPLVIELRDCPFTQQEQVLFFLGDHLPRLSGGALDKGGNGAFLAERARQHWGPDRIEEVSLSSGWYIENMPPMKRLFEDRSTTVPRDAEIRDDLRAIKKIRGVPIVPQDARTLSKMGGKRHGDAAVALCLAVFAARNMVNGPIEFESTGQGRAFNRMKNYMG